MPDLSIKAIENINTSLQNIVPNQELPFLRSHAFIIGNNNYHYFRKLKTAVNDAEKIGKILKEDQGFNVYTYLNASYKQMIEIMTQTMPSLVNEKDRVFFYFAGHGKAIDGDERPQGYIFPTDSRFTRKYQFESIISMQYLYEELNKLRCNHVLLVLDCCFAGSFKWETQFRDILPFMPKRIYKERFERFVKDPAWQVITSSSDDQSARDILPFGKRDNENMFHSPFALALIKGLQGAADIIPSDGGDGVITSTELYMYIRQEVESKTIRKNNWRQRQTPCIFSLSKHDKGEFILWNPNHIFNLPSAPEKKNPYKGLLTFHEEDKDLFYGRKNAINDLKKKIKEQNFIVISGASGTGKSSVVKAGLIPELRKKNYYIFQVIRPGNNPLNTLEKTLNESELFDHEISLIKDIDTIKKKLKTIKNVLVIDQFEEIITQCYNEKVRSQFIQILKALLDANPMNRFKLIITIRSDFEPQFRVSELNEYWKKGRYSIPIVSTGDLREMILGPLVQNVIAINPPELVDQIINDVFQMPGALPLLSFAMSQLYEMLIKSDRLDRTIQKKDYDEFNGVIGALSTSSDNLFNRLNAKHRRIMEKIMLRMVLMEGGKYTGKKVLLKELDFSPEENKWVKTIISILVKKRLIIQGNDDKNEPYIEPAHDALIKNWSNLRKWINENEGIKIILLNKLREAVRDYDSPQNGKLWNDDPKLALAEIELYSENSLLNRKEVDFIKKSILIKKQKKKKKMIIVISIIIALTVLSSVAIYKAMEAAKEARIAQSNNFSSQAQLKLNIDNTEAIRLAEKGFLLNENNNVSQVLSTAAASTFDHPFYNVIMQHAYHVNDAVFSPSGNLILTASSDKTAVLRNLSGNILYTFPHDDVIYSARFSPDGSRILTTSKGGPAKLWNLQGHLLRQFCHSEPVNSAVFSPDGTQILTSSDDNYIQLWNLKGSKLESLKSPETSVISTEFSRNGQFILAVSESGIAALWDWKRKSIKTHKNVSRAKFSPDDKHILLVFSDNTIKLENTYTNISKFIGYAAETVLGAEFTPDGNHFILIYPGGKFTIQDINDKTICTFNKHKDTINSITFSADGKRILTASDDKTAKMWNLNGDLLADFDKHKGKVNSAVFSPDGSKILTASNDYTARLWNLKEQPSTDSNPERFPISFASFSPNGDRVLMISNDIDEMTYVVKLCNLYGNPIIKSTKIKNSKPIEHTKIINTAVFSPDGTRILTASADNTAKLWNSDGGFLTDFKGHTDNVNTAEFSPDGTIILTASYDQTARVWDLKGHTLFILKGHIGALNSATFSPDGQSILTVSNDKSAKLWNLEGKLLRDFSIMHNFGLSQAIFSPNGQNILTISCSAYLWSLDGRPILALDKNKGCTSYAIFSHDNTQILLATEEGEAKLLTFKGKVLAEFTGHKGMIHSVLFSPDRKFILTHSSDSTAKLWNIKGNLLADFNMSKGDIISAQFSPDSKKIITVSSDRTVRIFSTPNSIISWLKEGKIPPLSTLTESNNFKIKDILH